MHHKFIGYKESEGMEEKKDTESYVEEWIPKDNPHLEFDVLIPIKYAYTALFHTRFLSCWRRAVFFKLDKKDYSVLNDKFPPLQLVKIKTELYKDYLNEAIWEVFTKSDNIDKDFFVDFYCNPKKYYPDATINDDSRHQEYFLKDVIKYSDFKERITSLQKLELQLLNEISPMKNTENINEVLSGLDALVYHNSPYLLKKADGSFIDPKTGKKLGFDHRFMGKGEGAQVHGWGCYFSVKDSRKYAENLPAAVYYDGKLLKDKISELANHALTANNLNIDNEIYSLKRKIETIKNSSTYSEEAKKSFLKKYEDIIPELEHLDQSKITRDNNNHNYVVEIPDDDGFNYLEEDKPIKPKQLAKIVSYLNKKDKKTGDYFKTLKGTLCSNIYYELTLVYKTKEMASKFLKKCGIVGIHYFGITDGECYVIFDENDAKIVKHELFGLGSFVSEPKKLQYYENLYNKLESIVKDDSFEKNGIRNFILSHIPEDYKNDDIDGIVEVFYQRLRTLKCGGRGLSSTPNAKSIGKNLSGMIDLNTQKMLWNYDFVPSDNKIFSSDTWRHKSNKVSIAFQAPKYYILIWDNDIVKAERKKYSNFINYFPEILKKIQKLIDKEYNIPTFHINDLITYKGYEETIFKIVAIKGNNYIVIDLADRTKTKNEIPMSDNDKLQIVNIDLLTKEIELEANNLGNVVESLQPSGLSGIDDEEFSKELLVTEMRLLELEKLKDFGEKIGGSAKDRYFGRKIKENTDTTKSKGYNRLPTLDEIENFGYKCLHTQFKPSVADFEEFGLNKICARLCFFHYYGIFDKDSGYNANSILDIYGLYDDKSIQDAVTSYFIENKYHTQNYATKYFAPDLKIHFYAIDFVYTALSLNLEKGLKDDFDYKNVLKLHNRGNKMWKIYRDKYIFQDKGKDNVPEDVKQRVFNICYENALTNFPVFRVMHSYNNGIVFMLEKDMSEGTRTWRFSLSVNHISNLEEGICENSWGDLYSHYAELYVKGKELYAQKYGIEEPDKWRFKDKEGLFAKVREGKDWRNGRNAEPKDFIDTFGFRAVEFGETMPQKERWEHLNRTFDSFMDLCDVLNIKPENISLGGSLAISFGSRGRGGKHAPAAHYEPTKKVINLTRRNGAGCLAHEWFHAFDNQVLPVKIGQWDFSENRGKFASNDPDSIWDTAHRVGLNRPDDYEYFYKLNNLQTNYNGFIDASFNLDKYERRSPKYWSTCIEYSARAFEWYVIKKLSDKNQINEYLAQIPTAEPDRMKYYPYPHPVDYIEVESIFNGIFANVQQVKTETGVTIR